MPTLLPDTSLKSLAEQLGPLPPGDVPAAWYASTHPEVLEKYEAWRQAHAAWRDRFAELCTVSGFDRAKVRIAVLGEDAIEGLYVEGLSTHTWWRKDKRGFWVPRKRTKAERSSEVLQRFQACRRVPSVLRYLPGLPHSLWIDHGLAGTKVYPIKVRKPGQAVLAFLGADPDQARDFPFQVGPQWSRLKLSTYHMIRERQEAEKP